MLSQRKDKVNEQRTKTTAMLRRVFSGIHSRPAISLTKSVAFEYLNRKSVRLSGIIYLQRNMAT